MHVINVPVLISLGEVLRILDYKPTSYNIETANGEAELLFTNSDGNTLPPIKLQWLVNPESGALDLTYQIDTRPIFTAHVEAGGGLLDELSKKLVHAVTDAEIYNILHRPALDERIAKAKAGLPSEG